MMVWNYRLILDDTNPDPEKHSISLHEVFYDKNTGIVDGWTEGAVRFSCDADEGERGVKVSLAQALSDCLKYPMLKVSALQPGVTVVMPRV